ncbi:MAG: hypothetical protein J0L62_08100 [Bacteroidetes bacterium]|nr:hypothetical protein [Bacteroidota bacterium]
MVKQLSSILVFSSLILNCTPEDPDPVRPLPPELIVADSLISYSESTGLSIDKGIGPGSGDDAIILRWKPYNQTNATEFVVYRTTQLFKDVPLNFKQISRFPVLSAQNQNSFRDTFSLNLNTDYYYRMTAISGSSESEVSNVVFYNLIAKPSISSPSAGTTVNSFTPLLEWSLVNASEFLIFVRERDSKRLVWGYITHPPSGYADQNQSILYGTTQVENPTYHIKTLVYSPLEANTVYEWKIISTQLTTGPDNQDQFYSRISGFTIVPKGSSTQWVAFKTKN